MFMVSGNVMVVVPVSAAACSRTDFIVVARASATSVMQVQSHRNIVNYNVGHRSNERHDKFSSPAFLRERG